MAKDVMVNPRKDGQWEIKTTGASKAIKIFDKQSDAVKYGKDLAKKNRSNIRIKDKAGKVRETRSYK